MATRNPFSVWSPARVGDPKASGLRSHFIWAPRPRKLPLATNAIVPKRGRRFGLDCASANRRGKHRERHVRHEYTLHEFMFPQTGLNHTLRQTILDWLQDLLVLTQPDRSRPLELAETISARRFSSELLRARPAPKLSTEGQKV